MYGIKREQKNLKEWDMREEKNKIEINEKQFQLYIKEAWEVRENAYAPYSGLKVGVVLVTRDGKIYKGCNIETPVMSLSICAERAALINALADGERNFAHLIIVAETEQPLLPCGACRQMLSDFTSNLLITSVNHKGQQVSISLKDLFLQPPIHK